MKPSLRLLPLLILTLFATACFKEKGSVPGEELTFVPVSMEIQEEGMDDTKSLVPLSGEAFHKAALFVFDSSGKILLNNGTPVTRVTTTKNISWTLPIDTELDLYVLANYGDLDLSAYLGNANLRESDLEALTFNCPSSEALATLGGNGYGLPMAGVMKGIRVTSTDNSVPIQTKKLFARYDFFFDTSSFRTKGYTVHAVYIASGTSNTEVPFFQEGFAQTDPAKLTVMDYGTSSDITELDYASRGHAITLYFLENCQGNKSGASHWWEVASSGMNGLNLCSYIDLGIRATDPNGNDMTFFYWIYLGNDCTTNFDVHRNSYRTIQLALKTPDEVPPTQGLAIIADHSVLSKRIPEACTLYFETNLRQNQLSVVSSRSEVTASLASFSSSNEHGATAYPYSGYVTAATTAAYNNDVNMDISAQITVGKKESATWSASDQKEVSFSAYVPTTTYSLSLASLNGTSATMPGTISLSATGHTYQDSEETGQTSVTSGCSWSSSSSACTVSGGVVSASAPGTYTITATHPTYGSATIDLTFSRPVGFEWTSANNQSVDEGETITLTYETSSSSPTISWNPNLFTKVSQSTTANTGTTSAYAYTGSITLRAADVDDDTTVTVSNSVNSSTRTLLVVALWNVGFQWADSGDITVDAGSSHTMSYASSSLTPSFSVSNPSIASVTYSASSAHLNGYKYSGTVTVSVDSGASDNASFTVSGSVGTDSDARSITVNKPVETTYSVEVKPVGTYEGSHNDSFTFNAYLVTYENGVEKSRKNISTSSYTSWKRADYDFSLLVSGQTVSSQYSGDEYHDKDSGNVVATYDGPEGKYSGSHMVIFRETYNVSSTIERQQTTGTTKIRVKLSADAPVQLYFYLTSTATLPDHNNGISAGDKYGEWILSMSQSDVDDLSVYMIRTWDNKSVYYDSNDKTYYYF